MDLTKKITPATEDYLEAIFALNKETGSVKSVDIAAHLGVTKNAVHNATHSLIERGFIMQEPYGGLHLTKSGMRIAKAVYERHNVIKNFLIEFLGVSGEVAEIDACKIEHNISTETLEAIKEKIKVEKV
jgi:Mn-dependent DtxR family transcriptional regulator